MIAAPLHLLPEKLETQDYVLAGTFTWGPFIDAGKSHRQKMASEMPQYSRSQRSRLACLRCRVRKLKCDGNTPCSNCIHSSVNDCSYEERRKPALSEKALTEKLATLQSHYDALTPQTPGPSDRFLSPGTSGSSFSTSSGSSPSSPGQQPRIEARVTTEVRDSLLKTAMVYLPRCNFDIDPQRIFDGLSLPPVQQPHPALINAIMLFGTYFASNTPGQSLPMECPPPEYFIQEIRSHMTTALSYSDRLIDYLSASVMLAWWLSQNGRFVEAHFEISSTARLGIDCGLHQIDEQTVRSVLYPGSVSAPLRQVDGILGSPASIADVENRVNVFWSIYLGDRRAAMMTGLPSAFDERTYNPDLEITTVFPRRSGTFSDPWGLNDFCSIDDLLGFPQIPSATPRIFKSVTTPQTLVSAFSQVVALNFRATRLCNATPRTPKEALEHRDALASFNQAMLRFTSQLPREKTIEEIRRRPPPYAFGAKDAYSAFFGLAQVRNTVYTIIIRMHQAAEKLQKFEGLEAVGEVKKITAAHEATAVAEQIFNELGKPECALGAKAGLCVINGYLWAMVATVYVEHIAKLRRNLPTGTTTQEIQLCSVNTRKLISAISRLAQVFPVLDPQVQQIDSMIKDTIGNL